LRLWVGVRGLAVKPHCQQGIVSGVLLIMNLIEGLQAQMERVRAIIAEYESLPNNAGFLAAQFMRISIKNAEKAISTGDTVAMLAAYGDLETYEI